MKVRFYSVKDLYDEVKDFHEKVVRMQFLEKTYSAEFKGAGKTFYQVMTEQILTLSVTSLDAVYYYSMPYFRYMKIELKNKAKEIDERTSKMKIKVREIFKGWTVKKGVYE